jgi:hypothetical protein
VRRTYNNPFPPAIHDKATTVSYGYHRRSRSFKV